MKVFLRRRMLLGFLFRHGALIVLVLFGFLGVWVVDDYGASVDTNFQRGLAFQNLYYVLGDIDVLPYDHNKFYGVAFELPLLLTELALGLDDTRDVYLTRHLATHLFFLAGGFFCYLLVHRLFENRLLAVLAMLLFLLHPRIYAHSFFNSKDVPFLTMFMVCLYLTHRAFGRGGRWWWFALCGVGVGLLINLRVMGVVLPVAVAAMLFWDLVRVPDGKDRKHVLASVAVFVLSSLLMVYATLPYLWSDPIGHVVEWFATLSHHPYNHLQLFRGEWFWSRGYHPPEYVPVWMSITTAPAVLVLGIAGTCMVLLRGLFRPRDALANTRLRFWLMLVGCFVAPVLAVMVLSANVYNGWRHVYFLYAPFCLLAVFGAHWMFYFFRSSRLRFLAYGAVGSGILVVAVSMVSIHPNQHLYFTILVDRTTPEHLSDSYALDYQGYSVRQGLEHLLDRYPSSQIYVASRPNIRHHHRAINAEDRHRLFLWGDDLWGDDGDFMISDPYRSGFARDFAISDTYRSEFEGDEIYSLKVYSNTIVSVRDLLSGRDVRGDDFRSQIYLDATSSGDPIIDSDWDVYLMDRQLVYVRESCSVGDADDRFFLHLYPVDVSDLPEGREQFGFDNLDFGFHFLSDGGGGDAGIWDGKCFRSVDLPEYTIERVSTGQYVSGDGQVWRAVWNLNAADVYDVFREARKSSVQPLISSVFDVYVDAGKLVYMKAERCAAADYEARFFLHLSPADVSDLPEERQELGFGNLDFNLLDRGGESDGECFAVVDLPAYEIAGISTGQYTPDGLVWGGGYDVAFTDAVATTRDLLEKEVHPAVSSVFDVYIDGRALIYVKSRCADADREARFFLHLIPADVSDLPEERQESGFDNLDFNLRDRGGESGGGCFAVVDLPAYEIAEISTGQYTAEGLVWGEKIDVGNE